jgi:uncharacterized phage-associated protein
MSSAKSVAKEMIRLSMRGPLPDPPTTYRLQCLLYYAQAWSLVLRDSELFPDDIEASSEGPVVPAILVAAGDRPPWQVIGAEVFAQEAGLDEEDEASFLQHLWAAYSRLSICGLFAAIQDDPLVLEAKIERETGGKGLIGMNELRESFSRRSEMPVSLEAYRRLRKERETAAELAILNSPPLDVEAIWKDSRSVTPSARKR